MKKEFENFKLTIELVPSTCFYKNVRSEISRDKWNKIRYSVYKRARFRCEICGGKGENHPVECHEIWDFDSTHRIQKLIDFIALCPDCHRVKHIGLAEIKGEQHLAMKQLKKVNGINDIIAHKYLAHCVYIWRKRSEHHWTLNISYLDNF